MKNFKDISNEEFNRLLFDKLNDLPHDQSIEFKSMDILRLFALFKVEEVFFYKFFQVIFKLKIGRFNNIDDDLEEIRVLLKDFSETRNVFFGEIVSRGED